MSDKNQIDTLKVKFPGTTDLFHYIFILKIIRSSLSSIVVKIPDNILRIIEICNLVFILRF